MSTEASPHIDVQIESRDGGDVAFLTVDNQRKLNILGRALMHEFTAAIEELGTRNDLRAIVIKGAGERAWIGGANILEMAELDAQSAREFITLLHHACRALRDCPVPVIAAIRGYTLGAGLELAAACDLRIATRDAIFGMPEAKVGIPSVIEAALLPSLIGWGRTRELLLFGENIDATKALDWGLIQRVVEPNALNDTVNEYLRALFTTGRQAIRIQKKLIRKWEDLTISGAIHAGIDAFATSFESDEPRRLMQDFRDRRSR
ncbi:MAG: enoyl-CoA hydratase/isomerase family protein [Methylobacteriaceae bacterium]|nr:enoyl-CoA hydratase/isomerase family protein [Methylobacteriaceae bacterium]